jgi:cardiolipin synthase A/B
MNETRARVLTAIIELARELPPPLLDALATELESIGLEANIARFGIFPATKERIDSLAELLSASPKLDSRAVALALHASAGTAAQLSSEQRVEIAWTGPSTDVVPLRRVDQVVYELIESARTEILLVTYVAYRAQHAVHALRAATERGVRVSLILEVAEEDGGKITLDAVDSFRKGVPRAKVFYWPPERRPRSTAGNYGAMHVKCIVTDRRAALVSSANLTDYALEVNMELGLLVRGHLPNRLATHFDQLIVRGELTAVDIHAPRH